jgi:hypothetical protein
MKVELYKEAVKWFPIKNITRKKPMLKLELFFIYTMVINLPKSYTSYPIQWAPGFTFCRKSPKPLSLVG